jgi:membrane protein implicated in regulation of membrane protease activity
LQRWIRFVLGMGAGFSAGALLPFTLQLTLFLGLSVLLLYLLKK